MKTICVFSQRGSFMAEFARLTASMLAEEVAVRECHDQPYLALSRLLTEHSADMYLLGYPHTDNARLFGNEQTDVSDVTNGANILVRQLPDLQRLQAHDTRPQGLACTFKHLEITANRALIIGKDSAAFAAALGCSWRNICDIDILNPGGFGNVARRWRGVQQPQGSYDLVINTMRLEDDLSLESVLQGARTVVDLVHVPHGESLLVREAKKRDCRTIGPILPAALRTSFALWRLFQRTPHEDQYVQRIREVYQI